MPHEISFLEAILTRNLNCRERLRDVWMATVARWPGSLQRMVRRLRHHFLLPLEPFQSATVTRKKVAGMDVASLRGLWFWRLNSSSNSFCKSAARPFFSAASNAVMVG